VVIAGWVGFMFATAVAALIPSLRLLTAPILCHAPYGHGVVQVHNYSYGPTSGYSLSLRCADAQHQEHGTSGIAVIGLLWLYGWIGALLIRAVYYWLKVAVVKTREERWFRRHGPPPAARPRPVGGTPKSLVGPQPTSQSAPAPAARGTAPGLLIAGGQMFVNSRPVSGEPDPVDQLARLADLHQRGALTDEEFAAEKAKILSR
jgi:hypothetical protein